MVLDITMVFSDSLSRMVTKLRCPTTGWTTETLGKSKDLMLTAQLNSTDMFVKSKRTGRKNPSGKVARPSLLEHMITLFLVMTHTTQSTFVFGDLFLLENSISILSTKEITSRLLKKEKKLNI